MAYTKQTWNNIPTEDSPFSADKMNHIEQGIYDNSTDIGETSNLQTEEKDNLVASINELLSKMGILDSLSTTAKNNLVASINELNTFPKIRETGYISSTDMSTFNIGSETQLFYHLTFTQIYKTNPVVLVSKVDTTDKTRYGSIDAYVTGLTTTGCDLILAIDSQFSGTGISYAVIQ